MRGILGKDCTPRTTSLEFLRVIESLANFLCFAVHEGATPLVPEDIADDDVICGWEDARILCR